jgi:hypothetical protein
MWASLLGALLAGWLTFTFGVALGRTSWLVCSRQRTFFLTPFAMLATLGLGFLASNDLCADRIDQPAFKNQEWFTTIPSTLFVALTLQAVTQLFMASATSLGPAQLMVAPCVAVHGCTALYYFLGETVSPSCVLITRWGTEVRPLHYALWWASMSAQLLTLNGLEHALGRRARSAPSAAASEKHARSRVDAAAVSAAAATTATIAADAERQSTIRCARALASIPIMLALTLYVDVFHGWAAMLLGVFASFYAALYNGLCAIAPRSTTWSTWSFPIPS